jgi:adenine deaminase
LDAYIIAGLRSDHECTNLKEAIESCGRACIL